MAIEIAGSSNCLYWKLKIENEIEIEIGTVAEIRIFCGHANTRSDNLIYWLDESSSFDRSHDHGYYKNNIHATRTLICFSGKL